jgi:putative DNA primase/helicase
MNTTETTATVANQDEIRSEDISSSSTDEMELMDELERALQTPSSSTDNTRAIHARFADIEAKPISWLWPGRIALGKITIIAGDPGLGKSLLTATMAAIISKGSTWPLEDTKAEIGSVVFLSAEDDPADTVKPRLEAAEADCERIYVLQAIRDVDSDGNPIERMFSLKRDLSVLENLLRTLDDCRLVIIDPISAYLGGTDSHNNSDVRGLLAPLAKLASDNNVAILLVQHLNKSASGNAMYRSMGSVAFVAASRAMYVVTRDPNDSERRLVLPRKNNLAKDDTGLAYSVHTANNDAPVLIWESEKVTITADEALMHLQGDEGKTDTDWAIDFLQEELEEGPIQAIETIKKAKRAGISSKSLRRATDKLGVQKKKAGYIGGWIWSLPSHEGAQECEGAPCINEGILESNGHLRHALENI